MVQIDINGFAVLAAAVASMVIGAIWYSPAVFGKIWMSLTGISDSKIKEMKSKGMAKSYVIGFIASLVTAYVLAHFVDYAEATTLIMGMQAGFWVWLGFIATTMIGIVLWENKPVKLYMLNVPYYLISLLVMGSILALWP